MHKGIFHAYGLFWRRDEIDWSPGSGLKKQFRLLGRLKENRPALQVADFRRQNGIYILYGNHGPYYVGLTKAALGNRLRDHLFDKHKGKWDRFSWFGFGQVLKTKDLDGLQCLKELPANRQVTPTTMISDIEALLIQAMAVRNTAKMNFASADEWIQIPLDQVERYLEKLQ